jgi:hypothetical protein
LQRIKAGGLGIEHDLAHRNPGHVSRRITFAVLAL